MSAKMWSYGSAPTSLVEYTQPPQPFPVELVKRKGGQCLPIRLPQLHFATDCLHLYNSSEEE
jgi:hypothetical protein